MEHGPPLRVLHVTYDMRIGGTEQVIRNLLRATDPTQVAMEIFCIEEPLGPWGEALRNEGVNIHSCTRRPGFDLRVVRALRRCLRRRAIDVVHCHQYTPWVYGALAALGTRTGVMFTEHGRFYPDRAIPKRRCVNPLLARATGHLTAISEATREALVRYEYLPADRIEVIYNGIEGFVPDPEGVAALKKTHGIPAGAPVLGTIARLDPIKNHRMLLAAFRHLLEEHPDTRLLLVGDGEERQHLMRQIAEGGMAERVIMPGYIDDPRTWLDAMDIFLLSSFSEGTSMTLLEAMSLGKPCVVTDVGGNREIVEAGANGLIVPSDDTVAYAGAISGLLGDGARANAFAGASRARFGARFTSSAMATAYRRVYDRLASARP